MKNLNNFKETAENERFKLIQINTDGNGYPRGLGSWGAIGFNTIKEAEKFAEENGGEVSHFETRDGHTFWRCTGAAYKPYSADNQIDDMGDNVMTTNRSDEFERFKDDIKEAIENEDFEAIEKAFGRLEDFNHIEAESTENQTIIYNGNCSDFGLIDNEMMKYSEDVYSYAIGVYFNPELHAEEEEEEEEEESI